MRSNESGFLRKVRYCSDQPRLARIRSHVEHVDLAVVEISRPKVSPVVGEPHVMCLPTAAHRHKSDYLAVALRRGIHVDRHQFVRFVTETLLAEGPDVNEILLALNEIADVRRITRFVTLRYRRGNDQTDKETAKANKSRTH